MRIDYSKISQFLTDNDIDAYLIPGTDPHGSEYILDEFNYRERLAGFSGSFGNLLLLNDKGIVSTDSRYEIQIKKQVTSDFFEGMVLSNPKHSLAEEIEWAISEYPSTRKIGVDPSLLNISKYQEIQNNLKSETRLTWVSCEKLNANLSIESDANNNSEKGIFARESTLDSQTAGEKIREIRVLMEKAGADLHIVSDLESIARITNLRGYDCKPNLLFVSYLVIGKSESFIYFESRDTPSALIESLNKNFNVREYSQFYDDLPTLTKGLKVLLDPKETNMSILRLLEHESNVIFGESLAEDIKKVKTDSEISNIKKASEIDCIALVNFFVWLENESKHGFVDEYSAGMKLLELRASNDRFICHSFDPIVGYMKNGAIVHYRAEKESSQQIHPKGIVLVDSGGHYDLGTTDITRVIALGKVTRDMIVCYTNVLRGHLSVNMLRMPKTFTPAQVDGIARQFLLRDGLDYGHGTGHAVGYGTSVHESSSAGISSTRHGFFTPNSIITNEPGVYKEGEFGIRIENMIVVRESEKHFYFDQVTLLPYEKALIDVDMLSYEEVEWINQYHEKVKASLFGLLGREGKDWLVTRCSKLIKEK